MRRKLAGCGVAARAKRWAAGRFLCRLLGDRAGGVMMEYVILAVLIAAACVVAVAMFGKTIVGMFDAAALGATGDHSGAKTAVDATRSEQAQNAQTAKQYHDGMHQ
jgi:Flp pilus assembly pilin Flp